MSLRWTAPTGPGDTSTELPPLGAMVDDGTVTHTVWAPSARVVDVMTDDAVVPMVPGPHGIFRATVAGGHGDRYRFRIDGAAILPDPMARAQPEGVRGPSAVVDPSTFTWTDGSWTGVALDELVLYELHVGTFTPSGTFDAARARLDELARPRGDGDRAHAGGTFPGRHGWGYDGLYPSAPHPAYGDPEALARLVDAAHAAGLGVVLDVVYNHLGPGAEAITAFGPYTDPERSTFWGPAIAFQHRGVREWAIQNAEGWVRDYHVDGLRLDAVHAIFDESTPHIVAELGTRVRARRARDVGHRRDGDRRRATDPRVGVRRAMG